MANRKIPVPAGLRGLFLAAAVFCLLVPNGYFLYHYFQTPSLMHALLANPLGQAFLAETMLLLLLFLATVYFLNRSFLAVAGYYLAAIAGGLAFALPLFFYLNSTSENKN